jgi:hypothetical protein
MMKPQLPTKPTTRPPGVSPSAATAEVRPVSISRGVNKNVGHKIVIYGPGGVGKSELCALLSTIDIEPLFVDVEEGTLFLDVARVSPTPRSWDEVRAIYRNRELLEPFGAVVTDSFTKLEELAAAWVLANVKHEKGHHVSSIEGYGFGKGLTHIYETFIQVLGDLDAIARTGKHVIAICHDCIAESPNPGGDNWIRYEPRLQSPPSGKNSIRHRVKEWSDHLFYIGFDIAVNEDGKAQGSGTRTIYTSELPMHWAKSRLLSEPIPYTKGDATLWQRLFGKEEF